MREFSAIVKHAITLLAGVILTLLVLPFFQSDDEPSAPVYVPTAVPDVIVPVSLNEQEAILGQLYDTVAPSVVSIGFGIKVEDDFIFTQISSGSGFVLDMDGHIMTNAHVLQISDEVNHIIEEQDVVISETRVEVRMFDGTITDAEIIGIDLDSDLAVIQINVPDTSLHPITFGDSGTLRVGETVLAIGNPFSNDWTMTTGIISALNRSIPGLEGFSIGGVIQTDAAINPGNSGGPLVNLDGEVIGVNSQINTDSGSNSGIGFAIPGNLAGKVAELLITEGAVEYSFIGIQSRAVDLDLINAFELPQNLRGVAVLIAFEDTPALDAGIQPLSNNSVDVITAIDGTAIGDFDELLGYLFLNTDPGDTITVTVYRSGDEEYIEIPLTLTHRPSVSEEEADDTNEVEPEATAEATEPPQVE